MLRNISCQNEKCIFSRDDSYCCYDEAVLNESDTCANMSLIATSREISIELDNLNPSEFINCNT